MLCAVAVAALAIVAHVNSVPNGFVWDDEAVVAKNEMIRSWRGLGALFTGEYFARFGEATYRPVVTVTYFVDCAIWSKTAAGYHLTNALLHAAVAALLALLAWRLTRRLSAALIAGALFAVVPVNAQAVNAIAFREDLLCGGLCLGAVLCFVSAGERRVVQALGLVLFALALLAKEMAVALPFALPCLLLWPALRSWKRFALTPVYFLVAVLYARLRFTLLLNRAETASPFEGAHIWTRLLTFVRVMLDYFVMIFAPHNLHPERAVAPSTSPAEIAVLGGSALIVALLIAAVAARRRRPLISLGIAWFLLFLAPVSNVVVPLRYFVAERYLYVPVMGLMLAAGAALGEVARRRAARIALALVMALWCAISAAEAMKWRDSHTLWSAAMRSNPGNGHIHTNLAVGYDKIAEAKAVRHLLRAIEIDPREAIPYFNLALIHHKHGWIEEAEKRYLAGLERMPKYARGLVGLARLYEETDRPGDAEAAYLRALDAESFNPLVYNKLAMLYIRHGKSAEAEKALLNCLRYSPRDFEAHFNLGVLMGDVGQVERARTYLGRAIELAPDPKLRSMAEQRLRAIGG